MRMRSIAARAIAVAALAITFAGCGSDNSTGHFAAYACANGDDALNFVSATMRPASIVSFSHVPIGVFRQVPRDSYDELMAGQIDAARARQGAGDLAGLLTSSDTWQIH